MATVLEFKGFEQFFPTYKLNRRWSDRVKVISRPLFPGYVFCRSCQPSMAAILAISGVNRVVSFGGKPCPVPDQEIEVLRKIASAEVDPRPFPYLSVGERVQIIQDGALFGIVGILTRVKNRTRLVVSVDMITKSISIDVDCQDVIPVSNGKCA